MFMFWWVHVEILYMNINTFFWESSKSFPKNIFNFFLLQIKLQALLLLVILKYFRFCAPIYQNQIKNI